MGARLKQLFERAADEGGITMPVKLAARTSITTKTAATIEDAPETIERVRRALDELLALQAAAGPRPVRAAAAPSGGRIKKYFDFAKQRGGVTLTASLAMKTCITTHTADTTPDTEQNLARVHNALVALLPGVTIPNF